MAVLLALGGCLDDETAAMDACKLQKLERAPSAMDGEYLVPCMRLKGYQFKLESYCIPPAAFGVSTCYESKGELARLRRKIFGK